MAHFVYTDFRYRYISLYILVTFVAISFFMFWHHGDEIVLLERLINLALVTMVFGVAFLLLKWRTQKSPKELIGEGDILLIVPICFWFNLQPFIYWFNGILIFALCTHLLMSKVQPSSAPSIPLAGYMALSFSVVQLWLTAF